MWTLLPAGILVSRPSCSFLAPTDDQRSDTLRYLLLLVKGGIYSDTDTRLRKPPSKWGQGATLWADGKGLSREEKARIAGGEAWQDVLGPPSIVVGVEADVGGREDWHEWWSRPVSHSRDAQCLAARILGTYRTELILRSKSCNGQSRQPPHILSCYQRSFESSTRPQKQ